MDVCLIPLEPSQWRHIALPNKFFEYSACNKPILTTDIPNIIDIGKQNHNLFIYNNTRDILNHIDYIYNNRPKFNIDASQFDWNNRSKDMEKVLLNLTKTY